MNSYCCGIILFIAIFALSWLIYPKVKCTKNIHFMFPAQTTFLVITIIVSLYWFFSDKEFLFYYGRLWKFVQKGSLEAISSTTAIIGVSSLLLGWTYGERDKTTLGKPQIEVIHYLYGRGYGISIIFYFVSTALCLLFVACRAKEAALWAFFTVIFGVLTQIIICIRIVFDLDNREKNVLLLWQIESNIIPPKKGIVSRILKKNKQTCCTCTSTKEVRLEVINDMANNLSDSYIRHNDKYMATIAEIIVEWTKTIENDNFLYSEIMQKRVQELSRSLRELFERLPKEESALWEEKLINMICCKCEGNSKFSENILSVSYFCFLYFRSEEDIKSRICIITQYSGDRSKSYERFCELLKAFYYGHQWYKFLYKNAPLSETLLCGNVLDYYIDGAFELLVSVLEEKTQANQQKRYINEKDIATIAWNQVVSRGK